MASLKNTVVDDTGFMKISTGTTAERTTAAAGHIRYNTTLGITEQNNGSSWTPMNFTNREPNLYYYEGREAGSFTGNWNNSATYTMQDFGQLGHVTAHGFVSGPVTFTLSLSSIPAHTQVRYVVLWHCVDSFDGETNNLFVTNAAGGETEIYRFTKLYNAAPSTVVLASGATATWSGSRTYSHRPWANGAYNADGYITIDTGFYDHALSTFSARHVMGLDQAQADEAAYLSHVQLWIR